MKRLLDVTFAILGLVACGPIFCAIAVAIWLEDHGPALFLQSRVGRSERLFTMLKFRSMRVGTPNLSTEQMVSSGFQPVTRVGAWLRRSSLDELPQLCNIFTGDMSFVGPRPALPSQLDLLELRRVSGANHCLPGLTGLAQVSGRDDLSVQQKAALDADYARDQGLFLDARIILETLRAVMSNRGNQ